MFSCVAKSKCKNADKIEGMASWLILGGVIPLAVNVVVQHQTGVTFDIFSCCYLWVIVTGITSLRVKRTSVPWRVVVALGAVGFLAVAVLTVNHPETANAQGLIWPLAMLGLIFMQYRCDMKNRK